MPDISELDKNFAVSAVTDDQAAAFFDCTDEPFRIYGVSKPEFDGDVFRRMPKSVAETVSPGVGYLSANSAGGRLRFKTSSPFVTLRAELTSVERAPHFTLCGAAGFDMYVKVGGVDVFKGSFQPPYDMTDRFESRLATGARGEVEITIHFPLYSTVKSLMIGLDRGCAPKAPTPYRTELPFVSYGSSITQGGCASRPGMSYQNILSRELSYDHINLGFSGNAKGEAQMADYIAGLPMSAFIYDYDHNAPTAEHLADTHEAFFKTVRAKNPSLPIIVLSRPQPFPDADELMRKDIIKATVDRAIADGDRNVTFVDGGEMMYFENGNEGTVDNCHPTDLGFRLMATRLKAELEKIIK